MFASDSVATRQISIFIEKPPEATLEIPLEAATLEIPPETTLETAKATDVVRGADTRAADSAGEISISEVTHLFEIWSGLYPVGHTPKQ